MSQAKFDQHFQRVRHVLGSTPDEGWVFGVCPAVARHFKWDLWAVRLVAIIALLIFPVITVLGYFAIAMISDGIRPRAQAKMRRWAQKADRFTERLWSAFSEGNGHRT